MGEIQIIGADGKILYDSDTAAPEQYDAEREHIAAGPGWKLQTREQLEREIAPTRPDTQDCPTCEGQGWFMSLGEPIGCPTCHAFHAV